MICENIFVLPPRYWPGGSSRRAPDFGGTSVTAQAGIGKRRLFLPDGQTLPIYRIVSSPGIKNISLYPKIEIGHNYRHPVPVRGAYHDRHERRTGSGGRWCAENERRESVRQRRVVL